MNGPYKIFLPILLEDFSPFPLLGEGRDEVSSSLRRPHLCPLLKGEEVNLLNDGLTI